MPRIPRASRSRSQFSFLGRTWWAGFAIPHAASAASSIIRTRILTAPSKFKMGICRGSSSIVCAAERYRKNGMDSLLSLRSPLPVSKSPTLRTGCPMDRVKKYGSPSRQMDASRIGPRSSRAPESQWRQQSPCASPWLQTRKRSSPWPFPGIFPSPNSAADASGCATTQNSSERREPMHGRLPAQHWRTIRIGADRSMHGKSPSSRTNPSHFGIAASCSTNSTSSLMAEHSGGTN